MTERNVNLVLGALSTLFIGLGIATEDQVGIVSENTMLIIAGVGTITTSAMAIYNSFTAQ